jgi:methoxymalonate biosynthesis acyl carrier protein
MDADRGAIRAFIATFVRNPELADADDIFALGHTNSLFAMQLVLFVEKRFGITVENEDLDIENFRSIDAIASFVDRKLGVQQSAAP